MDMIAQSLPERRGAAAVVLGPVGIRRRTPMIGSEARPAARQELANQTAHVSLPASPAPSPPPEPVGARGCSPLSRRAARQ